MVNYCSIVRFVDMFYFAKEKMQFCNFNGVTLYRINSPQSRRYAMFDLDDTLVKYTKTNKFIPLYDNTFQRLNELVDRGYNIVIITSRAKITHSVKKLITEVLGQIKHTTSIFVYIASSKIETIYKKPRLGVYFTLVHCFFNGHLPDKYSFYIGDAYHADRTQDINLASNFKFNFSTPELFFNNPLSNMKSHMKIPKGVGYKPTKTRVKPWHDKSKSHIILSGDAGVGKSFYARKMLSDYGLYYNFSEFKHSKMMKKVLVLKKLTESSRDTLLKNIKDFCEKGMIWYHIEAPEPVKNHNLIYYNIIANQLNEPKRVKYKSCDAKKPMVRVNYKTILNMPFYYTYL